MTGAITLQRKQAKPTSNLPSWGASALANVTEKRIANLQKLTAGAVSTIGQAPETQASGTIEGQLRIKLGSMQDILRAVSMYFDSSWRAEIIAKLDQFHDGDDWEEGRALPSERSFATFLRALIYLHPTKRPGVGLSTHGHFLASWRRESDRIVIEFLPNDELKWVLSQTVDGERESGAGINQIHRLPDLIAGYEPERFLNDGEKLLT